MQLHADVEHQLCPCFCLCCQTHYVFVALLRLLQTYQAWRDSLRLHFHLTHGMRTVDCADCSLWSNSSTTTRRRPCTWLLATWHSCSSAQHRHSSPSSSAQCTLRSLLRLPAVLNPIAGAPGHQWDTAACSATAQEPTTPAPIATPWVALPQLHP